VRVGTLSVGMRSLSEERATDPDDRGSLLDRELEVVAHPHRQRRSELRPASAARLGSCPQVAERPARLGRVGRQPADGHQSPDLEMREVEGRATDDVADILSLPPGTVRVHLHRARMRLRAKLSQHFRGAVA